MMKDFVRGFKDPGCIRDEAFWFAFKDGTILVRVDEREGFHIPLLKEPGFWGMKIIRRLYLGTLKGKPCYATELTGDAELPEGMRFHDRRRAYDHLDPDIFHLSGYAGHLIFWDRDTTYCGRCGFATINQETERSKKCPECDLINYPRLSPAVIVAIIKDGKILLARHKRFTRFYSVLAGFVEPGETLEECVHREIKEESGIDVKNISYFGSQPWPFPDSLMVGFTAEYAGGELKPDETEIEDLQWFTPETLPNRPGTISIAGRLINWFIANHS